MKRIKSILLTAALGIAAVAGHPSLDIYGWASPWAPSLPTEQQISHLTHLICYSIYPNESTGKIENDFDETTLESLVEMAHRNDVKVLFSFGTGREIISTRMLNSPEYQTTVVSGIMDVLEEYGVEGFDNAWEPSFHLKEPEKHKELLAMRAVWNGFNKEIRDSLDARFGEGNKEFTVTIMETNHHFFVDTTYNNDAKPYPDSCWLNADRVMLMSYGTVKEAHGAYDEMVKSVDYWVAQGMPKEIIVPGFSFDASCAWVDDSLDNGTIIPGTLAYCDIIGNRPDLPLDQDTIINTYYDTTAMGIDTINTLYGFSGVMTTRKKLEYIYDEGLPGSMFWQIGMDAPLSSPHSLIREISSKEPFKETVKIVKSFPDEKVESSDFILKYPLSEYFGCTEGTLQYSVASPKRHSVEILNDTLTITGDGSGDIGISTVAVTAHNSDNLDDKKSADLSIICYSTGTQTIGRVASENLVLSETWIPWGKTPQKSSKDVKRVNRENDTTVNLIGELPKADEWISADLISSFGARKLPSTGALRVVYRGENRNPLINGLLFLKDKHGVTFQASIPSLKPEWRTVEFTQADFKKGWEQPSQFDFENIVQLSFSFGGTQKGLINIEVKEATFASETSITPVSAYAKRVTTFIHNGSINFSSQLQSDHSMHITDLRGRRIWSSTISKGVTAMTLPTISPGVYILNIGGAELNQAAKLSIQ